MTINYTPLLSLAEPVTGTQSGTWGDDVNQGLTNYLDIAVAGTQTISGSQTAVTLTKTTGSAAASNIAQVGAASTGTAQYAVIRCNGNPVSLLTITAPASSKTYVVINATSTNQPVKIVGAGPTTGVTVPSGKTYMVVWNGSDFITTSLTPVNLATDVTGILPIANGGTGLSSFTANGVVYASSTSALATSSALQFNGANLTVSGDFTVNGNKLVMGSGAIQEHQTSVTASNIDLVTGNCFTKTISGATTFTVSNVPPSGTVASFILDITNGGSATVNWWSGVKWPYGTAPSLTVSGRDSLGFYTYDGGTTWTGLLLGKDIK